MKKIIISVLSVIMLLMAPSCSDYLKVDYYDILPGDYAFESEANVNLSLAGCYDTFYPSKADNEAGASGGQWGFKPQFMLANHPTMDTQASGWDRNYCTQDWTSSSGEFITMWVGMYKAISRCNVLLDGLEGMDPSLFKNGENAKKLIEAQARAIRGFNYLQLAKNFGRVPMLLTGETYLSAPAKPRPASMDDTWKVILEDLSFAAAILDWTPIDGQYGRVTRGFCLGYQAEALMFQARNDDGTYNEAKYNEAKQIYLDIIQSGKYELVPCYSYLFDPEKAWQKEDLFAIVMWTDNGKNRTNTSGWSPTEDHYITAAYNTASMEYNGWGSLFISWECYYSFESGDRRRAASMVALSETNPWTQQTLGVKSDFNHEKIGAEFMPNISSLKYWRVKANNDNINPPFTMHYLRYSHILLNYAECCFFTNDASNGWDAIDQIRERAWGNLEVTLNDPTYPIPMQTTTVTVPDAETYYTNYKATKGYTTDVGILAVNMERRHEFNAEFNFFYDLKRSGIIKEFINIEYPKNTGIPPTEAGAMDDWHTYRTFEHSDNKMLYPIPYQEILTNDAIGPEDQNPGY